MVRLGCRAKHDNRIRHQFEAIGVYLLSRVANKGNSELSWVYRGIRGSGQCFLGFLKRKPIELDRHKIGSKIAAPGDYALRSHVAERRVKSIEVGEGVESAPGHLDLSPSAQIERGMSSLGLVRITGWPCCIMSGGRSSKPPEQARPGLRAKCHVSPSAQCICQVESSLQILREPPHP